MPIRSDRARRIARTPLLAGALVVISLTWISPAVAAHDVKRLELDGNATNGSPAGTDWGSLFPGAVGVIASVFVADGATSPPDASYFTGGGSKDTNDTSAWERTTGDVAPDKNEITNAYAIAVRSKIDTGRTDEGDLLFYFGADRYANNGDAQMGFWFLRGSVGLTSTGFTGSHQVGDILVLAHFTQGGKVGSPEVYRWVGSGGSDGALDLVVKGGACSNALSDDKVCSIANTASVSAPWSYEPKSGAAGTFAASTFFEGGINVSRLAPGVECFSSYLAETRSSQSVDAQLKDLALGTFDTCPPPKITRRAPDVPLKSPRRPATPQLARSGPEIVSPIAAVGVSLVILGCALVSAASPLPVEVSARVRLRKRADPQD